MIYCKVRILKPNMEFLLMKQFGTSSATPYIFKNTFSWNSVLINFT